jgi:hypothetical protein
VSLDIRKLAKVRRLENGTLIARCPACATANQDREGNHLVVYPNGSFGCVVYPGQTGSSHRKQIWQLAGDRQSRRAPLTIKFSVKRK